MSSPQPAPGLLRFGLFEMDPAAGELRKENRRIKLQAQPFQVLVLLLRRPGEVVTREELQEALWHADTFVEFDQGLNTAIKKIRLALGDSADNPRFIETVPRKGYRFIAPVNGDTVATALIPVKQSRERRLLWAATLLSVFALLGVGFWLMRVNQNSVPEEPAAVPLTSYRGDELSPSFSPDGNYVAFAWNGPKNFREGNFDILVKLIDGGDPIRITQDPADDVSPAWSPDGRLIAFLRALPHGAVGVSLIPAIGGSERMIAELHGEADSCPQRHLSWFPDNKGLAVVDQQSPGVPMAVFRLSVETGEKTRLTFPQGSSGDWDPAVSPDGRTLLFRRSSLTENTADLFLLQLSENLGPASEPKRLTIDKNAYDPAWTPDGREIIFSAGPFHTPSLWKLRLSSLSRPGKLERLTFAGDGAIQPVVSRRSGLAYSRRSIDVDIWRLNLNGWRPTPQPPVRLISSTRVDHDSRYSPDGEHIAFASNRSGGLEIWVCKSDGSASVQLTSLGGLHYTGSPRWSPDGKLIAFTSNAGGKNSAYVMSADGGKPQRLPIDDLWNWSRDGKWVYFSSRRSGEEQLWKMPWPLPRKPEAAVQVTRKGCVREPVESLDGKFIYYLKGASENNYSLWRIPAAGGEEIQVLGSVFHDNFAVADRGIYFIPSARPASVQLLNFANGAIETIANVPREPAWGFSVSPDGRSLLFSEFEEATADLMLAGNFR